MRTQRSWRWWSSPWRSGLMIVSATAVFLTLLVTWDQLLGDGAGGVATGFAVDRELLRKARGLDYSSLLCWQQLRRPFLLRASLDVEVAQNVQGTLVNRVPAFSLTSPSRSHRHRRHQPAGSSSKQWLDWVSDPPPYSHTESQGMKASRVNQIDSPLTADGSWGWGGAGVRVHHSHPRPLASTASDVSQVTPSGGGGGGPFTPTIKGADRHIFSSLEVGSLPGQDLLNSSLTDRVTVTGGNGSTSDTERRARNRDIDKYGKRTNGTDHGERNPNNNNNVALDRSLKKTSTPNKQVDDKVRKSNASTKRRKRSSAQRNTTKREEEDSAATQSTEDSFLTKPARHEKFKGLVVARHSWERVPVAGDDHDDDNEEEEDSGLFIYSAFYDARPRVDRRTGESEDTLRVLGVVRARSQPQVQPLQPPQPHSPRHHHHHQQHLLLRVFCHYRWKDNPDLHVIQRGRVTSLGGGGPGSRNHAVFLLCDLQLCAKPDYVGITLDRKAAPQSYLPVQYPPPIGRPFRHHVTTCLPVMPSHFSDHVGLLKMLETDLQLGTGKFTLYIGHSLSPEVAAILRDYVTSGVMEVIEWQLPPPPQPPPPPSQQSQNTTTTKKRDVNGEETDGEEGEKDEEGEGEWRSLGSVLGQLLAANDCLYRHMYHSRHILFHGFLHAPVPRQHATWRLLLRELQEQETSTWWNWWRRVIGGADFGSYTFQHAWPQAANDPHGHLTSSDSPLHIRTPHPTLPSETLHHRPARPENHNNEGREAESWRNSIDRDGSAVVEKRPRGESNIQQQRGATDDAVQERSERVLTDVKSGSRRRGNLGKNHPPLVQSEEDRGGAQQSLIHNHHLHHGSDTLLRERHDEGEEEEEENNNRGEGNKRHLQHVRPVKEDSDVIPRRGKQEPAWNGGDNDDRDNHSSQGEKRSGRGDEDGGDDGGDDSQRSLLGVPASRHRLQGTGRKENVPSHHQGSGGISSVTGERTLWQVSQQGDSDAAGQPLVTLVRADTVREMSVWSAPVHLKGFTSTDLPPGFAEVRPLRLLAVQGEEELN